MSDDDGTMRVIARARQFGLTLCRTEYRPDPPCTAACYRCYRTALHLLLWDAWRRASKAPDLLTAPL